MMTTTPPAGCPPRLRILICLKPDAAVQRAIDRFRRGANWPASHVWTPPQRLHLTLQCWDHFPANHLERLRDALRDTPVEPLDIVLGTPQLWHDKDAVLLAHPRSGLQALHQRMRAALARAGFHTPRSSLQPHVTLAYNAVQATPPRSAPDIPWQVRGFELIWSQCWPEYPRAHHTLLQRYGLTPGRLAVEGEEEEEADENTAAMRPAPQLPLFPGLGLTAEAAR